jgi:DNA-binding CsgD family transcriptional regulator
VPRLAEKDYRGVLAVLRAAGDSDATAPFAQPVLEALRRLVPCDVVAYHEAGQVVYAGDPLGAVTPEIRAAHRRLRHRDPLRPADGARKVSDFVPLREYRRTELYQSVDRPLGVEYLMQLYIEPRAGAPRLEFDRATTDFGERDRAVLDLLLPHLRQMLRRSRRGPSGTAEGLTPRELRIVKHVAEGKTNGEVALLLQISPETVRKHLENAYAKLGVHTRTAAVAAVFGR